MAKLSEEAKNYVPMQIKTVAELDVISTDLDLLEDTEAQYPYKYIEVGKERYKVPDSVLASLKEILAENQNITKIKIKKSGEGIKSKYTVVPIM